MKRGFIKYYFISNKILLIIIVLLLSISWAFISEPLNQKYDDLKEALAMRVNGSSRVSKSSSTIRADNQSFKYLLDQIMCNSELSSIRPYLQKDVLMLVAEFQDYATLRTSYIFLMYDVRTSMLTFSSDKYSLSFNEKGVTFTHI